MAQDLAAHAPDPDDLTEAILHRLADEGVLSGSLPIFAGTDRATARHAKPGAGRDTGDIDSPPRSS